MSRNRMNNQDYPGTLPDRQSQIGAPGTSFRQSGRPKTHLLWHPCVWGIISWPLHRLRAVGAVNGYKSLLLVAVATAALNYDKIRAPLKNVVIDAAALTCRRVARSTRCLLKRNKKSMSDAQAVHLNDVLQANRPLLTV